MGRVTGIVKRLVWILVIALVVVVAATGALIAALTLRGFPTTAGTIAIAGLAQPVRITRDASGIPWIEAESPHDLFLAQGYVHAQDRMWQMEVWRHISSGRLSELFGSSTLSEDRFIRTLGWRQSAERDLATLSPEARAALDAYAAGVNDWIADHHGSMSLPFVVTGLKSGLGGFGGYDLEPWTAVDTLAWQKVQAWQLGGNYDSEVFRMLADLALGDPARTNELFPPYDPSMPVITPSGLKGSGGAGATAAAPTDGSAGSVAAAGGTTTPALTSGQAAAWRDLVAGGNRILAMAGLDAADGIAGDHQVGSNDFVVGPSKTTTKTALLANDPHLGIGMPSVWYINGLRCRVISKTCPWNVAGVTFPGVPGVVLGHNATIAWGATNVDPDVQDLFAIQPDPKDANAYLVGDESVPYVVRHETIKVAGGAPVEMDVRSTRDGPILNDVDTRLKDAPPLALRWTATDGVDGTFDAIFHLDTASNFDEFHAAFRTYGAPSQNFVYADVKGHIGYVLPGRIPIRADASDRGDRIRSGSDGKHDWTGTIPFEDLPWQLDPPSGMIVTANNAAVDDHFPYFIAQEWDPGYRAKRITDLLQAAAASGGVSTGILRSIQMDPTVTRAERVIPHLVDARPSAPDGDGALIEDRILNWSKHDCTTDSLGCTAYEAFEYRLVRDLVDDELGPLAREYVGSSASLQAMITLLDQPDSPWWDDVRTTDRKETRDDMLGRALDEAGAELRAAYGDPANWTWGRVHQATFEEATLGSSGIGPLEWYFNKGPYAAPGAAGAVNNVYYRPSVAYPDPDDPSSVPAGIDHVFDVTNLPSYRLSMDMADLDGARIIQTTGQSGNPFDRHYGDLINAWLLGDTVPLPFSPTAVHEAMLQTLALVPKQ